MRKIRSACVDAALLLGIAGLACLSVISCSQQPTNAEKEQTEVRAVLSQIPGCRNHATAKAALKDSCFSYQFAQTLVVDFCVSANCCPDSGRFDLTYEIRNDTIDVAVADTAANLCRCVCTYVIHAEFTGLRRDRYVFCCHDGDTVMYAEAVERPIR